nr:prefoldin subunit 5-like [Halyomorpha halys]
MSLEIQMQKLALELRNLSTYQLEGFKEVTETAAMHVHETNCFWKGMLENYKNSWDSLDTLSKLKVKNTPTWIKLTDYIYIEGEAAGHKKVLVDIGGDYFVYMTLGKAKEFFERRGAYGMEMLQFYESLFYKKRLVYFAIDEALKRKLRAKLDKIDKMREKYMEKEQLTQQ